MASTFDDLWQEAMGELEAQLHVEGVDEEDMEPGAAKEAPREVTIFQAFQHFACLYIKYIQIFRKLEECYDGMIHPQKRIEVKKVLELVIRRVTELKNDLVKWNPPNSYVRMPTPGVEEAFPWEYVHLDDILVDLKLSPETLEIPVPKYFREDQKRLLQQRDKLVSGYMRLKHNTDEIFIGDDFTVNKAVEGMTLDKAIDIIQRNERGRQGHERFRLIQEVREKEKNNRVFDASAQLEMDTDIASTNIQRMFMGHVCRIQAKRERQEELQFVGMRDRPDDVDALEKETDIAYRKRKQEQMENKEIYERALDDLKDVIVEEEGPEIKEQLREERTLWVTDQLAQEKFPDDLEDYYKTKLKSDEAEDGEEPAGKGDKKDKKADKKDDKKKDKKDKKDKKGKKGGGDDEEAGQMPQLQGKTELVMAMADTVGTYEKVWDGRDEEDNFQQRHDVDLGKEVVRPGVFEDLRKQVDDMLIMNLKKIKAQLSSAKGGKGKKGKKGKKKGKGKKGKKGKKDKKKKPLPGDKIGELKGMDTDQMLSLLIESKLVVRVKDRPMSSLIGEFNYLGSMHHSADRKDEGSWDPPDPSIAQLRAQLTEYLILPNGSAEVKMSTKQLIKSVMLYGPSGSGKTHAVEAIAHELGALLIHLTPDKLRGQFGGKSGPTKLVHLAMTVARDPAMQPCIIYVDECEQFFTGGKKNKDKDGPSRFKKDLLTYKNQALDNTHRVAVIGCTKTPENGDMKDMKAFFDKFLYMPYPDYASRLMTWRHYLNECISEGLVKSEEMQAANSGVNKPPPAMTPAEVQEKTRRILDSVDLSSLAFISEGYTAGAIARTVRSVATTRRVTVADKRPITNVDFLDNLSLQEYTFQDDKAAFMGFTKAITGMDDRRKKIEAAIGGEEEGGKDAKKKK